MPKGPRRDGSIVVAFVYIRSLAVFRTVSYLHTVPGGQHEKGTNGERREERAHETAQQQAKQRLR
eukprot:COSAG03_NODE_14085_length_477_cov_244.814815_2_plen_64_part_01